MCCQFCFSVVFEWDTFKVAGSVAAVIYVCGNLRIGSCMINNSGVSPRNYALLFDTRCRC